MSPEMLWEHHSWEAMPLELWSNTVTAVLFTPMFSMWDVEPLRSKADFSRALEKGVIGKLGL